jgi:hypothetical protein
MGYLSFWSCIIAMTSGRRPPAGAPRRSSPSTAPRRLPVTRSGPCVRCVSCNSLQTAPSSRHGFLIASPREPRVIQSRWAGPSSTVWRLGPRSHGVIVPLRMRQLYAPSHTTRRSSADYVDDSRGTWMVPTREYSSWFPVDRNSGLTVLGLCTALQDNDAQLPSRNSRGLLGFPPFVSGQSRTTNQG